MRVALFLLVLFAGGQAQAQWNNQWVYKTIREQKQTEQGRTARPAQPQPRRAPAPVVAAPKAVTPPETTAPPQTGASETVSPAVGAMPPS